MAFDRKEYMKLYRLKHKEKIQEQEKRYREEHKKHYKELNKQWRLKNKGYYKERYNENPEKYKSYQRTINGRANSLLQGYRKADKDRNRGECDLTKEWIIEHIFSQPCAHCGKTGWDVIGCNRLDDSRPHTMDNVEPCCEECNIELHSIVLRKKVYQYTLDGILVAEYSSATEAAIATGFKLSSICKCCSDNYYSKTYKGYIWSYKPLFI